MIYNVYMYAMFLYVLSNWPHFAGTLYTYEVVELLETPKDAEIEALLQRNNSGNLERHLEESVFK